MMNVTAKTVKRPSGLGAWGGNNYGSCLVYDDPTSSCSRRIPVRAGRIAIMTTRGQCSDPRRAGGGGRSAAGGADAGVGSAARESGRITDAKPT